MARVYTKVLSVRRWREGIRDFRNRIFKSAKGLERKQKATGWREGTAGGSRVLRGFGIFFLKSLPSMLFPFSFFFFGFCFLSFHPFPFFRNISYSISRIIYPPPQEQNPKQGDLVGNIYIYNTRSIIFTRFRFLYIYNQSEMASYKSFFLGGKRINNEMFNIFPAVSPSPLKGFLGCLETTCRLTRNRSHKRELARACVAEGARGYTYWIYIFLCFWFLWLSAVLFW